MGFSAKSEHACGGQITSECDDGFHPFDGAFHADGEVFDIHRSTVETRMD